MTARETMTVRAAWLEPHYSLRLVLPFVRYLGSLALHTRPLLAQLAAQPADTRIPISVALRMLDGAVAFSGFEDLGLRAADAVEYGSCDVIEFAAASAPTFGAALENVLRYVRILNESAQFTLEVRESIARVEMHASVALNRAASDYQVAVLAKGARAWAGSLADFEVWFSHDAPADITPYRRAFDGAVLRFGAPHDGLLFPSSLLTAPMPGADPVLHAVLRRHADHLLSLVPESPSIVPRVREVLTDLLRTADMTASRVAARLGMSRRTLARHLEREGVSFMDLLERVRHEQALAFLRGTEHDVQQIAFLLGYSLTAAFSRAFRRWEGCSPTEFRRSLPGGGAALSRAAGPSQAAS